MILTFGFNKRNWWIWGASKSC